MRGLVLILAKCPGTSLFPLRGSWLHFGLARGTEIYRREPNGWGPACPQLQTCSASSLVGGRDLHHAGHTQTYNSSRLWCTGKTSESAEALSREDVSEGPVLHPALCRLRVFKATSIIHCTEESMESKYSVFRMHESYYIRAALVMF